MFRLRFEVDGAIELERMLDIAADSVTDFSEIFRQIADDFRSTQEEVFKASGAFEGLRRWAPLEPGYASWKTANYGSKPILTLTGKMRKSLTQKRGPGHIEKITDKVMEIGTKDKKAIYHQRGTSKMKQRKVIELSEQQKRRWTRIAHTELFRSMTGAERQNFQSR